MSVKSSCCVCKHCGCGHPHHYGIGPFLGRLFLSLLFLIAGLGKIVAFSTVSQMLSQTGIRGPVETFLVIGILLEIVGGLMILLGWFTRVGVILLMVFLLVPTFAIHSFWNYEGAASMDQFFHFLKNIGIYGGLILLLCYGPGSWSFDYCRCCKKVKEGPLSSRREEEPKPPSLNNKENP